MVLDGAWGTMLQGAELTPEDYRGDLFARPPPRRHRRPGPAQPDPAGPRPGRAPAVPGRRRRHHHDEHVHRDAASARPTTGCSRYVREMNLRGAQLARQAADEAGGTVRRRLGRPAERHPVAVAEGGGPGVPGGDVRRGQGRVRRADRGAGRRRRRPAADRDDLRHAQRQGRRSPPPARSPRDLPLWISVTIVDLSGRTLSGQTVEAFWRSIEHARAAGRRASTARWARPRCARTWPSWPGSPAPTSPATPTPACRTRSAATTRRRTETAALLARVRRVRAGQHRRRLLRHRRPATSPRSPPRSRRGRRAGRRRRRPRPGSAAWSRSRSARTPAS